MPKSATASLLLDLVPSIFQWCVDVTPEKVCPIYSVWCELEMTSRAGKHCTGSYTDVRVSHPSAVPESKNDTIIKRNIYRHRALRSAEKNSSYFS
jgi:hypothetical protein